MTMTKRVLLLAAVATIAANAQPMPARGRGMGAPGGPGGPPPRMGQGARFLDAAFTKQFLSGIKGGPDLLGLVGLGDRDQLDVIERTTRFLSGLRNLSPNALEVFCD